MKLLAADRHVLAFAAVTRALRKWQVRNGIARIFATELCSYGFARVASGQNANAAQQAEPVRIPKRTQCAGNLRRTPVHRALLKEHWYPVATEKCAQAEIQDNR
jgi:hypothetical protein